MAAKEKRPGQGRTKSNTVKAKMHNPVRPKKNKSGHQSRNIWGESPEKSYFSILYKDSVHSYRRSRTPLSMTNMNREQE